MQTEHTVSVNLDGEATRILSISQLETAIAFTSAPASGCVATSSYHRERSILRLPHPGSSAPRQEWHPAAARCCLQLERPRP